MLLTVVIDAAIAGIRIASYQYDQFPVVSISCCWLLLLVVVAVAAAVAVAVQSVSISFVCLAVRHWSRNNASSCKTGHRCCC